MKYQVQSVSGNTFHFAKVLAEFGANFVRVIPQDFEPCDLAFIEIATIEEFVKLQDAIGYPLMVDGNGITILDEM